MYLYLEIEGLAAVLTLLYVNYQRRFHIWIRKADKTHEVTSKHKTIFGGLRVVTILAKLLFVNEFVAQSYSNLWHHVVLVDNV